VDRPTPQIQVIVGSTRPSRSGEQVARWVASLADARGDLEVELVDLRDWPLPFFDSPVSPRKAISDDPRVQAWAAQVASADGYVLVLRGAQERAGPLGRPMER
jgi:NAD(P)H-dependent FMN reductase